jgi:hypothetical protein
MKGGPKGGWRGCFFFPKECFGIFANFLISAAD